MKDTQHAPDSTKEMKELLLNWWQKKIENADFFNQATRLLGITCADFTEHADRVVGKVEE